MLTAAREDCPRQSLQGSWPLKFFEPPRFFDRKSENLPYIKWVEDDFDYVEEDSEEEDNEDKVEEENDWDNALVCTVHLECKTLISACQKASYSSRVVLPFPEFFMNSAILGWNYQRYWSDNI